MIYEMALTSKWYINIAGKRAKRPPALLQANRQIREEASSIYYLDNRFAIRARFCTHTACSFLAIFRGQFAKSVFSRSGSTFPMEAFLKRCGASRYEKRIRAHWQISIKSDYPPWTATWGEWVIWASQRWKQRLPKRAKQMSWPSQITPRVFEFWMILISLGFNQRYALMTVRFLQWIINEQIPCKWTMEVLISSAAVPRGTTAVQLTLPAPGPSEQLRVSHTTHHTMPPLPWLLVWNY